MKPTFKKALLLSLCLFFCFQGYSSEINHELSNALNGMLKLIAIVGAVVLVVFLTVRAFIRKPR